MKLGLIFNIAPKYRENIYHLLDNAFDCYWYFGQNNTDIKSMNLKLLKNVTIGENRKIYKSYYWQRGVFQFKKQKVVDAYLLLGNPFCLSMWLLLIQLSLFHPSIRIYMWTHGWYGRETFFKKKIKKIFFEMTDGVFLYGNYAKQLMVQEGFNAKKLFVVHNSLNYEQQLSLRNLMKTEDIYLKHFGNKNHTLIFIVRLTSVKKINLLIETIAFLKKQKQYFNLVIVGDGAEKENLQQLALKKGLLKNIWFYGACYDESINARLLYNADLCVSPGNVGLTAIHSLMFGTPVVTHNSFENQMPEFEAIKEGKTGAFFLQNDIYSMANVISNWFNMKISREQIRQNCYTEIDTQWNPRYQMRLFLKVLNS